MNKNNSGNLKKIKNGTFDSLVMELKTNLQTKGCCSDKNVCDIRCSPLNGGYKSGKNGCC